MLEDDFPPDTVEFLKQELGSFSGKCYYDVGLKQIVYYNSEEAMIVYMGFQVKEMEKHKWLESEKAKHDLGEMFFLDWDRKYASDFCEFWKKTHVYVVSKEKVK